MKALLAILATFGLVTSAAAECGASHTAAAHDAMTTASIQTPMSTRADASKDTSELKKMTGGVAADKIREEPAE